LAVQNLCIPLRNRYRYYYVPSGFSHGRAGRVAAQLARRTCQNPLLDYWRFKTFAFHSVTAIAITTFHQVFHMDVLGALLRNSHGALAKIRSWIIGGSKPLHSTP